MAGTVAFMNIQPAPHTAPHQCRVPWLALMNRLWAGAAHGASGPKYRFTVIHGPNILGSYAILFFTASDFTFTTRPTHKWVSFLLWPSYLILSGTSSNCPLLFPSSIWDTFQPGGLNFRCHIFWLFILFTGFLQQECWSGLPFPPPVDHVLSELFTMTRPPWMPLHSMAHSFIELCQPLCHDKGVTH